MVVLVAMFAMAKWSREKTVNAVEQFVGLCGHLFFLVSVYNYVFIATRREAHALKLLCIALSW